MLWYYHISHIWKMTSTRTNQTQQCLFLDITLASQPSMPQLHYFRGGWKHSSCRRPALGGCERDCLPNINMLYVLRGLDFWRQHSFTAENKRFAERRIIPAESEIYFFPVVCWCLNTNHSHNKFLNTMQTVNSDHLNIKLFLILWFVLYTSEIAGG